MQALLKKYKYYMYQVDYKVFNTIKSLGVWYPDGHLEEQDYKGTIPEIGSVVDFSAIKKDSFVGASYQVMAVCWSKGTGYTIYLGKAEGNS
ncbi:hypothetical protein [Lactobacillus phage Lbab1]|nr:hypothetical protein [Lactobacillus phage Lbab1]